MRMSCLRSWMNFIRELHEEINVVKWAVCFTRRQWNKKFTSKWIHWKKNSINMQKNTSSFCNNRKKITSKIIAKYLTVINVSNLRMAAASTFHSSLHSPIKKSGVKILWFLLNALFSIAVCSSTLVRNFFYTRFLCKNKNRRLLAHYSVPLQWLLLLLNLFSQGGRLKWP